MSFKDQIIVIFLCYLLSLFFIRGFLYGIKRFHLNNSSYKKRKKGETFSEWLFYKRYKEEIPKILLTLYYSVLIIHPACLIVCFLMYIIALPLNIGNVLAISVAIFDAAWMLIISLLFWSPGRDYAFARWITKKRGQRPKK